MNIHEAQKRLTDLIEPLVKVSMQSSKRFILNVADADDDYRPLAESMARGLLKEALDHGISNIDVADLSDLSGGAASDFVFRARSSISLIIKVQRDVKLKGEAVFLKSLQPDIPNATAWGSLFPRVLAMQVENPPYAYAMEDFRQEEGYKDLSKWIFDDNLLLEARIAQADRLLNTVMECLCRVYQSSKDTNSRPNLDGDAYLGRIQSRMTRAETLYQGFAAEAIQADDKVFNSWHWYIDEITKRKKEAEATLPNFQTAIHGDSHPGNIIIRLEPLGRGEFRTEVRLIDPRGWHLGDYIFDLAKLSHYFILTGPVERWSIGSDCEYSTSAKTLRVGPLPTIPSWLIELERRVFDGAVSLGTSMGDNKVATRYALAMASSYLGSVPVRWENGQQKLAVLMYVEGLRWLEEFQRHI